MKRSYFLIIFLLISLVIFPNMITFLFTDEAEEVFIIGEFTNYEPVAMEKTITGAWRYRVNLEAGEYLYKYKVDGERILDYRNSNIGVHKNEIFNIRIVEEFYIPQIGDGRIKSINHSNERKFINPIEPGKIYLAVEVEKNDIEDISIQTNGIVLKKEVIELNNRLLYRFLIKTDFEELRYRFLIEDGKEIIYGYNNTKEFFKFDFKNPHIDFFNIPEWTKGNIIYQIFPERFRNGDPTNDPLYVHDWYGNHTRDSLLFGFYGGDLQGVIDSVEYLNSLGVETIYFNPLFKASTTHKYNTEDYFKIDPSFGTEETFKELISILDEKEIRVILDGVFNHTGIDFFAMKENFNKQENSNYLDWYYIKEFPIRESPRSYESWHNYASLPQLNNDNPEVRAYINKIISYWSRRGISGWRLDAVDQVARSYWSDFIYKNTKAIDRNLTLIGEYWIDSTHYFQDPSFDSVMNYIFRDAAISFSRGGRSSDFVNRTNSYLNSYPPQVLHGLWNMLGSHDTERILTYLNYDLNSLKIAVGLQMTFIGSPVIYYGDEIGMIGGNDPFCREPFPWNEEYWNLDILDFYKTLMNYRKESKALKMGDYRVIKNKNNTLIFERTYGDERVIVIANSGNRSEEIKINLDENYYNLLDENVYNYIENLEGRKILILTNKY